MYTSKQILLLYSYRGDSNDGGGSDKGGDNGGGGSSDNGGGTSSEGTGGYNNPTIEEPNTPPLPPIQLLFYLHRHH